MGVATEADERRIWDLLTRDFYWDIPVDHPVTIYGDGPRSGPTKLQIFEVAVATIMARIHPDYEWKVTRNGPDGGLDFIGQQAFLQDSTLDIAAAITVGGQCKKRTEVKDILDVVGPSGSGVGGSGISSQHASQQLGVNASPSVAMPPGGRSRQAV